VEYRTERSEGGYAAKARSVGAERTMIAQPERSKNSVSGRATTWRDRRATQLRGFTLARFPPLRSGRLVRRDVPCAAWPAGMDTDQGLVAVLLQELEGSHCSAGRGVRSFVAVRHSCASRRIGVGYALHWPDPPPRRCAAVSDKIPAIAVLARGSTIASSPSAEWSTGGEPASVAGVLLPVVV